MAEAVQPVARSIVILTSYGHLVSSRFQARIQSTYNVSRRAMNITYSCNRKRPQHIGAVCTKMYYLRPSETFQCAAFHM